MLYLFSEMLYLFQEYDMEARLGTKGQLVIEKPIRDQLGIRPGSLAIQRIVDDHVEIRFVPAEHERSLRGRLAEGRRRSVDTSSWNDTVDQAWRTSVGNTNVNDDED